MKFDVAQTYHDGKSVMLPLPRWMMLDAHADRSTSEFPAGVVF